MRVRDRFGDGDRDSGQVVPVAGGQAGRPTSVIVVWEASTAGMAERALDKCRMERAAKAGDLLDVVIDDSLRLIKQDKGTYIEVGWVRGLWPYVLIGAVTVIALGLIF